MSLDALPSTSQLSSVQLKVNDADGGLFVVPPPPSLTRLYSRWLFVVLELVTIDFVVAS